MRWTVLWSAHAVLWVLMLWWGLVREWDSEAFRVLFVFIAPINVVFSILNARMSWQDRHRRLF